MDIRFKKSFFVLIGLIPLVYAEDQQSINQSSKAVIEEVFVTGQKMEQDLQEVMDSISVISGEEIEKAGIEDFRDALLMISNVNSAPTNNSNSGFVIRGINSEGVGEGGGNSLPTASLVLDGAVQSVEGVRKGAKGVWDLSSVEVLRGPQIALGRNALAGAINIKTKDPELGVFDSSARAVFSTQGHEQAVFVNIPIHNDFSLRIAGEKHSKDINIDYSEPRLEFLGEGEFESIRTKLLYEPSFLPDFSAKLTFSTAEDSPPVTAVSLKNGQYSRKLNSNFGFVEQRVNDVDNYILDLNYQLSDFWDFTSVSTYTKTTTNFITPNPKYDRQEERIDRDLAQDIRFNYNSDDGRVSAVIGVFGGRFKNNVDSIVVIKDLRQKVGSRIVRKEIEVNEEVTAPSCVKLNLLPNNGGQFFMHESSSFFELGRNQPLAGGDGPWFTTHYIEKLLNNGGSATSIAPNQPSAWYVGLPNQGNSGNMNAKIFANGNQWNNAGTLTLNTSSLLGIGSEKVNLVDSSFTFGPNGNYIGGKSTAPVHQRELKFINKSSVGTASYNDGKIGSINANINMDFNFYDSSFPLLIDGNLKLKDNGTFTLTAGDPNFATKVYPSGLKIFQRGDVIPLVVAGLMSPYDAYFWNFSGKYTIDEEQNCSIAKKSITRKDPETGKIYRIQDVEEAVFENKDFVYQNFQGDSIRKNKSVYAKADWQILDNLKLISGIRYENESYSYTQLNRINNQFNEDETSYSSLLPKLGLMFYLTESQSLGFVITKGYRGGFVQRKSLSSNVNIADNTVVANSQPVVTSKVSEVDPETLINEELIYRGEWLDRRLVTNVNFFKYDWTDQQVSIKDPQNELLTEVKNAGSSKIYGIEFTLNAAVNESWTIGASLGYLKTKFVDFGEISGNEFPQSPQKNGAIVANYQNEKGWFFGADMNYQDRSFTEITNNPFVRVKSRTLINARTGYEDPAGRFRVTLDTNNLTNKKYLTGRQADAYIGNERVISLSTQFWWN